MDSIINSLTITKIFNAAKLTERERFVLNIGFGLGKWPRPHRAAEIAKWMSFLWCCKCTQGNIRTLKFVALRKIKKTCNNSKWRNEII